MGNAALTLLYLALLAVYACVVVYVLYRVVPRCRRPADWLFVAIGFIVAVGAPLYYGSQFFRLFLPYQEYRHTSLGEPEQREKPALRAGGESFEEKRDRMLRESEEQSRTHKAEFDKLPDKKQ